ncbi:hypothetical protein C6502_22400 [Candidatus Poribacteria bacterium]|nr:MAG: hypothetical protein C6502_22400 [Candidatus Poribacteria bacterium]
MRFFDTVEMAPPDPILGLNATFKADPRSNKVNLSIGAYKTDDLQPLVLAAVRKAEQQILTDGMDKEYLSQDGDPEYVRHSIRLVFDTEQDNIFGAQAPGGTAGVRLAGEFLSQIGSQVIYIPDPTWANHNQVFARAGLEVASYPYYDAERREFTKARMIEAIKSIPSGSPILLHACCHNPTGLDPTPADWKDLSTAIKVQGLLPVFDFAYQGFGRGIDEDAMAVRHFLADGHQMLVANSYSKNFGLYGERIGGFYVVTADAETTGRVKSQVMRIIRANYSNPPLHGSRIIAAVLASDTLREEWENELSVMRERISGMRKALAEGLNAGGSSVDFSFMYKQNGMFSYSGLSKDAVDRLREEFAIYMPTNGRLNVAGLSPKNLDYVVEAILAVL